MDKITEKNQKDKIIEIYKDLNIVSTFDNEREEFEFMRFKNKFERGIIINTIKKINKDKLKVLDVACGTGRFVPELLNSGKVIEYHGLDTSEEMLKVLKERVKERINLHVGDASNMPFENETFDLVYTYHLLWHLPKEEQEKIVSEMFRVTKKDGIVIFDLLNKDFVYEKIKKIINKKPLEGIYKLKNKEVSKMVGENKNLKTYKLSDFPVKNKLAYSFLNIQNKVNLPKNMYHMLYVVNKKILK